MVQRISVLAVQRVNSLQVANASHLAQAAVSHPTRPAFLVMRTAPPAPAHPSINAQVVHRIDPFCQTDVASLHALKQNISTLRQLRVNRAIRLARVVQDLAGITAYHALPQLKSSNAARVLQPTAFRTRL